MRRALVVIALALTMLVAAAWPVVGSVAQPSPTDRADQVDFNGDGFDDLAIGVPAEGVGGAALAGAVNILYGGAGGLAGTNQLLTQGNPEPVDLFGFAVAKGDFNADGFTDLAVGAPSEDVGAAGLAGAVNVFYGSAAGLPATSQVRLQANPEIGDQFGLALAAGFFSGSIFSDLAVGAPTETVGTSADAGAVSVFLGSASQLGGAAAQTLVQGPGVGGTAETGDEFGSALAAGPFDTGPSDLAIGAPFEDLGAATDAGAVNVVYGSNTGLVGRNQTLTQNSPGVVGTAEPGDLFGVALARGIFLNNFNGDDFADLAIGVAGEDVGTQVDAGAVNVQYGAATGLPGPGGQLFTQDSPGVGGTAESGDGFGAALD
jgi:hypothetical protein